MSERADQAWEKAAACQAHALAATDNKLRAMFLKLRQSWIRIGNDAQFEREAVASAPYPGEAARPGKI
jgi:hypothetical protein